MDLYQVAKHKIMTRTGHTFLCLAWVIKVMYFAAEVPESFRNQLVKLESLSLRVTIAVEGF